MEWMMKIQLVMTAYLLLVTVTVTIIIIIIITFTMKHLKLDHPVMIIYYNYRLTSNLDIPS